MDSRQRRLKYSVHRGPESTLHFLNTSFLPLRFASSPGSDTSPYHINMPIKPTSASLPGRCQSRDHSSRRDANRPWDTRMLACRPTGTQHGGNGTISLPHSQISQLPSKTPIPSPPRQPSPLIDANHPLPASPEPPHRCQKRRSRRTPRIRTVPRLGAHYVGTYDVASPLHPSRLTLSAWDTDLSRSRKRAGPVP
jgi:hypothetical protein